MNHIFKLLSTDPSTKQIFNTQYQVLTSCCTNKSKGIFSLVLTQGVAMWATLSVQ